MIERLKIFSTKRRGSNLMKKAHTKRIKRIRKPSNRKIMKKQRT